MYTFDIFLALTIPSKVAGDRTRMPGSLPFWDYYSLDFPPYPSYVCISQALPRALAS